MPRDTDILCICCGKYMPRSRERAHREKLKVPYANNQPQRISGLRRVTTGSSEDDDTLSQQPSLQTQSKFEEDHTSGHVSQVVDTLSHQLSTSASNTLASAVGGALCSRWRDHPDTFFDQRSVSSVSDNDDDTLDDGDYVSDNEDELLDDELEQDYRDSDDGSGLSPWDLMGEKYTKDASIGNSYTELPIQIIH